MRRLARSKKLALTRFVFADNQWHTYFYQQNNEGSVTHLTDSSGNVLEYYRYDVFGAPTVYAPDWSVRQSTIYDNRFLFTGREYAATYRSTHTNAAFSFYEYRVRAYSPTLGRFMYEDPKLFDAGDYNLYRYCHNDPLDITDPMGLGIDNPLPPVPQWTQLAAQARDLAERAQSTYEMDHTPNANAMIRQGFGKVIERIGRLALDNDGVGKSYGDKHHKSDTSGWLDASGRIVPHYNVDGTINRNAVSPLNADRDPYGVAPKNLSIYNGGKLAPGDREDIKLLGTGKAYSVPIGDLGPNNKNGEMSIAQGRIIGFSPVIVHGEPLPSANGRTTPDIR